ncbi:hypothetical protein [Bradyrhizobium sp. USDA 10063]
MPEHGTAVATYKGADGKERTLIVPAIYYKGHFFIDADTQHMVMLAMRATGVEELQFEFAESDC